MRPFLTDHFGNPSSHHWAGAPAKAAVERARGQVAGLLGARPDEVVFTSGGTEANNHALQGVVLRQPRPGRPRRHHARSSTRRCLKPLEFLRTLGAKVTVVPVDRQGRVDPGRRPARHHPAHHPGQRDARQQRGRDGPAHRRDRRDRPRRRRPHAHRRRPERRQDPGAGGRPRRGPALRGRPQALRAQGGRRPLRPPRARGSSPLMHGAGHESGRRAGTENVLLDVALGAACELAGRWTGAEARPRAAGPLRGRRCTRRSARASP